MHIAEQRDGGIDRTACGIADNFVGVIFLGDLSFERVVIVGVRNTLGLGLFSFVVLHHDHMRFEQGICSFTGEFGYNDILLQLRLTH